MDHDNQIASSSPLLTIYSNTAVGIPTSERSFIIIVGILETACVLLPRFGRSIPLDDDSIFGRASPLHLGNLLPCNLGANNTALAIDHVLLLAGQLGLDGHLIGALGSQSPRRVHGIRRVRQRTAGSIHRHGAGRSRWVGVQHGRQPIEGIHRPLVGAFSQLFLNCGLLFIDEFLSVSLAEFGAIRPLILGTDTLAHGYAMMRGGEIAAEANESIASQYEPTWLCKMRQIVAGFVRSAQFLIFAFLVAAENVLQSPV